MYVTGTGPNKNHCCGQIQVRGKCKNKFDFKVVCPRPRLTCPPFTRTECSQYTVGGGEGDGSNIYTINIPRGATTMTSRLLGGGGSGGGMNSLVVQVEIDGDLTPIWLGPGGGGGAGFETTRTFILDTRLKQIRLQVGLGGEPAFGDGADGDPTFFNFIPNNIDGFTDTCTARGGGGGTSQITLDISGSGGDGKWGGGGGGNGTFEDGTTTSNGLGGKGIVEDGEDGGFSNVVENPATGGIGGANPFSGGDGTSGNTGGVSQNTGGGGGGGGLGGGISGITGSLGVSNKGGNATDLTHGGGGSGGYMATSDEAGTTIQALGGRGGHGLAEICFLIQSSPH